MWEKKHWYFSLLCALIFPPVCADICHGLRFLRYSNFTCFWHPDVVLCGWLGSKHQLTNKPTFARSTDFVICFRYRGKFYRSHLSFLSVMFPLECFEFIWKEVSLLLMTAWCEILVVQVWKVLCACRWMTKKNLRNKYMYSHKLNHTHFLEHTKTHFIKLFGSIIKK